MTVEIQVFLRPGNVLALYAINRNIPNRRRAADGAERREKHTRLLLEIVLFVFSS